MPIPARNQDPFQRIAEALLRSGARLDTATMGQVARGAQVKRTTTQNVPLSPSVATISFETEEFDTDGFWTSGSPTRITVPPGLTGLYVITAHLLVGVPREATVALTKNGADMSAAESTGVGGVAAAVLLKSGDYIELKAFATGAGSQSSTPRLTALKV